MRISDWSSDVCSSDLLVSPEHDADVLLEVEDWVRESLIEAMDRQDLVAATGSMDADELADLAPDLPPDVVAEVQKGLTEDERAQVLEAMGDTEYRVGDIMELVRAKLGRAPGRERWRPYDRIT